MGIDVERRGRGSAGEWESVQKAFSLARVLVLFYYYYFWEWERDRERESGQKISCVGGKLDVRDVMVTERNEGKHTTLACTKARMRNILGPITHTQRCRNGKMDEIAARTHTHAHTWRAWNVPTLFHSHFYAESGGQRERERARKTRFMRSQFFEIVIKFVINNYTSNCKFKSSDFFSFYY